MTYSYSSTQATNCAVCGEHRHTPLRVDRMGGYVCLTCIDKELDSAPKKEVDMTDDEIVEQIEHHKSTLKARRQAVYQKCASIAQELLNDNGANKEVVVRDQHDINFKELCIKGVEGRGFLFVFYDDRGVKSYPVYIGNGDKGSLCKSEKEVKKEMKKYLNPSLIKAFFSIKTDGPVV